MEHDIRFRDDYFEIVYSGEANPEGFDSVLHDLTGHESWRAGRSILNDYRTVNFAGLKSYSKMESVADVIFRYREKLGRIRVADVFSESEIQTYANLEKTIRSYHGYEFEYYSTNEYDKALSWVKRRG